MGGNIVPTYNDGCCIGRPVKEDEVLYFMLHTFKSLVLHCLYIKTARNRPYA